MVPLSIGMAWVAVTASTLAGLIEAWAGRIAIGTSPTCGLVARGGSPGGQRDAERGDPITVTATRVEVKGG
jgi:hypothetical protein